MKPLTETQALVLDALRAHCKANVVRYRESCPHLYQDNLERISKGDKGSVWGLGSLTWQLGKKHGMAAEKVLRTFKTLESRGLVIREERGTYQRPLYWWPVGLAGELVAELTPQAGHAS
ncbi:hypothetical protein [Pseudomonas pseudonitroreducens]|uniref:hypothetical protein n=1 Tax=Pseudomonas pseudonitroreducens TaxID=2892326 RepID=UPI001F1ED542|nr:hypothetical protein [Pseudomonas pseudonitroreducens]